MTKSELIEAVAERTKITKSRAELVVNCVFDAMTAALERGEGIEIRGYGSFTVRSYKPYDGRNPRTGNQVSVPSKRLPFFKVGKELKTLVNDGQGAITAKSVTNGSGAANDADDDDDDDDDAMSDDEA
jgi:integration host factor subunit beta